MAGLDHRRCSSAGHACCNAASLLWHCGTVICQPEGDGLHLLLCGIQRTLLPRLQCADAFMLPSFFSLACTCITCTCYASGRRLFSSIGCSWALWSGHSSCGV